MQPKEYSISALSVETGKSRQFLAKILADTPAVRTSTDKRGTLRYYRMRDVIDCLIHGPLEEHPPLDLNYERARLASAQANEKELDVAVKRGELIPWPAIRETWSAQLVAFKAQILATASRIAQQVAVLAPKPGECEALIRDNLCEALDRLREYRHQDYQPARGQEAAASGGTAQAAAAADGKPMGRSQQDAKPKRKRRARQVAD